MTKNIFLIVVETTEKLHHERKKEAVKGNAQKMGTKKSVNRRKETKLRGILTKKLPPKYAYFSLLLVYTGSRL